MRKRERKRQGGKRERERGGEIYSGQMTVSGIATAKEEEKQEVL